jgi:hypothetical protein
MLTPCLAVAGEGVVWVWRLWVSAVLVFGCWAYQLWRGMLDD